MFEFFFFLQKAIRGTQKTFKFLQNEKGDNELILYLRLGCNCRIRFGSNNLFVFLHPEEAEKLKKKGKSLPEITYEYAQNEIAKHSGLNLEEG